MYGQNNFKNVLHGFFLAIALTVAEPSTTLPLIVHHFTQNVMIVGLFTSLLRGGAIVVQLFAAFYAQTFSLVMPYLRRVFLARFLSWFGIGVSLLLLGEDHPLLTLVSIGIGLFIFSFSAGFGSIYFNEILAKIFTKEERGRSMANRQFFAALGSIFSGVIAGFVLEHFSPPKSYGYLFLISSLFMAIGLYAFSTIQEPIKKATSRKEKSFLQFLKNSFHLLRKDSKLQKQITTVLLSYSFLFSFAFIILQAKEKITLTGWLVGGFIVIQMSGALLGNIIWKRLSPRFKKIMILSFSLTLIAFTLLLFFPFKPTYFVVFFLLGMAIDGFRIASMNLLFEIAPESQRPVYVALQNNLTSIGLFFAIPGGFILHTWGYQTLYGFTISMLCIGLIFATRLHGD